MSYVDISMFNTDALKLTLFYSLVNKSTTASPILDLHPSEPNYSDYAKALAVIKRGHIDRYEGRVIKGNLSGNTFSTHNYNRDNGFNAAENIIQKIRTTLNI
jgi:hypothetical protein